MFAMDKSGAAPSEAKRGVTFEDEIVPGPDSSLSQRITFYFNKSPLADPSKRFLLYNVSLFGAAVFGVVKYGAELAI
jgi:hypothetical protein